MVEITIAEVDPAHGVKAISSTLRDNHLDFAQTQNQEVQLMS